MTGREGLSEVRICRPQSEKRFRKKSFLARILLHATGADVKKEDLARLSPLSHKHFNMLGRYHFAVPEEVLRGELRAGAPVFTFVNSRAAGQERDGIGGTAVILQSRRSRAHFRRSSSLTLDDAKTCPRFVSFTIILTALWLVLKQGALK